MSKYELRTVFSKLINGLIKFRNNHTFQKLERNKELPGNLNNFPENVLKISASQNNRITNFTLLCWFEVDILHHECDIIRYKKKSHLDLKNKQTNTFIISRYFRKNMFTWKNKTLTFTDHEISTPNAAGGSYYLGGCSTSSCLGLCFHHLYFAAALPENFCSTALQSSERMA